MRQLWGCKFTGQAAGAACAADNTPVRVGDASKRTPARTIGVAAGSASKLPGGLWAKKSDSGGRAGAWDGGLTVTRATPAAPPKRTRGSGAVAMHVRPPLWLAKTTGSKQGLTTSDCKEAPLEPTHTRARISSSDLCRGIPPGGSGFQTHAHGRGGTRLPMGQVLPLRDATQPANRSHTQATHWGGGGGRRCRAGRSAPHRATRGARQRL
jgi:hypothetical protein